MFQKKLSWIIKLFLDQRGEDDPAAGAGDGSGAGDGQGDQGGAEGGAEGGDSGAGPAAGVAGEGAGAGAGQEGVQVGKFGEFGDDPVKLFQAYQGIKGKTTATERNLATLRKNLESAGLKIGEDGTIQIGDNSGKRTKRFTEEHAKLFDQPVLQAMQGLIEDYIEDHFGKYEQRNTMKQQYISTKQESNSKMVKMFPGLVKEDDGEANLQYNEAFYNRATEIWQSNPGYKSHPSGELFAAMEASIELGISPIAIAKAKAAGYKAGVGAKKVLGPAGGGAGAQGVGGFKRLSVEEFRKLAPDKKEEYQQQLIKQSK